MAGFRGRVKAARAVVEGVRVQDRQAKIAVSSLYRWDSLYRESGFLGLVDRNGRPPKKGG
jgi:hypothetical protein